jgi:hypothetical protein
LVLCCCCATLLSACQVGQRCTLLLGHGVLGQAGHLTLSCSSSLAAYLPTVAYTDTHIRHMHTACHSHNPPAPVPPVMHRHCASCLLHSLTLTQGTPLADSEAFEKTRVSLTHSLTHSHTPRAVPPLPPQAAAAASRPTCSARSAPTATCSCTRRWQGRGGSCCPLQALTTAAPACWVRRCLLAAC